MVAKLSFYNVTLPRKLKTSPAAKSKAIKKAINGDGDQSTTSQQSKYEMFVFYHQPKKNGQTVLRKRRLTFGKPDSPDAMQFFYDGTDGSVFESIWDKVGMQRGKKLTLGDSNFSHQHYIQQGAFLNKRFWQQNILLRSPSLIDNLHETIMTLNNNHMYGELLLPVSIDELPPKISKNYIKKVFSPKSEATDTNVDAATVAPPPPTAEDVIGEQKK